MILKMIKKYRANKAVLNIARMIIDDIKRERKRLQRLIKSGDVTQGQIDKHKDMILRYSRCIVDIKNNLEELGYKI